PCGRSTAATATSPPAPSPSSSRSSSRERETNTLFLTGGGEAAVGRSAKSRAPDQAAPPLYRGPAPRRGSTWGGIVLFPLVSGELWCSSDRPLLAEGARVQLVHPPPTLCVDRLDAQRAYQGLLLGAERKVRTKVAEMPAQTAPLEQRVQEAQAE